MTDQNNAAQAAEHEAVRRALEPYAESYDMMARIAQREDRLPVVSPVSVAVDIRKNMVNAVVDALSKLRAEGVQAGDERAAFEEKFPMPEQCVWAGKGYSATDYNAWNASKHASRWEGWQARAALASSPVADESPMAKMADALREKGRQEQQAYQDSRVQSTEWGPMPHGTEADLPASAPVAGEAQKPVAWKCYDAGLGKHMLTENPKVADMLRAEGGNTVRPLVYADAAPASEAVRDAALEEAAQAAYLALFPKNPRSDWTGYAKDSAAHAEHVVQVISALKTQADEDGGDCAKGGGYEDLLALMERAAREAGGSQWVAEGFESRTPGAAFYGGLIMNADGETVVAQCVNESNASHMMSSSPANVLWLIRQYRAALSPPQPTEQGERDAY
ncbi:hypothetical protein [Achromobacter marplatensis]|uniref:hypothetical protein n=1 Tax=Achromobacter marplatensis TaxID=470868 RepID=UPI000277F491|nr:hypothetical protein [Achromobacter marplatensis]EJO27583.1 hypothetical protein QWC_31081 [Achromobacter marplatensis]